MVSFGFASVLINIQVAGRWHLLSNARDTLERWLARAHARLRRLPMPPGGDRRQRICSNRCSVTNDAASSDSRACCCPYA